MSSSSHAGHRCATTARRGRALRVLTAFLLFTSLLTWVPASPAGAWSTSEGAVAIHSDSNNGGQVTATQVDSAGNIYACGHFRGTGDVDPDPTATTNVTVTGTNSSVVSKYSPSGNLLWYVLLDADGDDQILDCSLNDAGTYLAVAGKFKGTMNFPSEPNIASAGGWDAYVALISTSTSTTSTTAPNGVAFGKTLGGTGNDEATGVDFGGTSIYVGGTFHDTADVDWKTTSTDNRTSAGDEDAFLSKFGGSGGTLKWTKTWGCDNDDMVLDVVVDRSSNDIYIGGWVDDSKNVTCDYDPGAGTVMVGGDAGNDWDGQGGQDSWISKFSPMGDLQWAKNFGSNGHDKLMGMHAASGYVYATGYQKGSAGDWDPGPGTIQLGSTNFDPYTVKLDSSGVGQWAFAVGGASGAEMGMAVTTDSSGNVYTTGYYTGTSDLESGSGTTNFTANANHDVFLLKHNSSGVHQWAKAFPSGGDATGNGVATDTSGNVYIAGYAYDWMDFDSSAGDATVFMNSTDGWVAKYTSAGALATGNAPLVENPPPGFQVVHGPVDGDQLQGFEAEVVLTTPLCDSGQWEFAHTLGYSTRHYVIQDSALTASGLGIGAYIKANYTDTGSTIPDHNLLWVAGSANDHDGNTSSRPEAFGNLGWAGQDASGDVTFKLDADGSFKWKPVSETSWVASTVDYDGAGSSATGVVPSGWSVYLAFAAKDSTTLTLDSGHLSVAHSNCGAPGFAVSETSRTVSETGSTQTFTVELTGEPSSNVVVDVTSSDTGEATVSPAQLTFTDSNWSTPQTVTVTGIPDSVDDGDQVVTVTLAVNDAASDDDFDSLADQTVAVTVTDVDTAALTLSLADVLVTEAGTDATFTAVLGAKPTSDVVIDVTGSDTGEATVSPAQLTFTDSNWDSAQTVTVTGVDDTSVDGNQTSTVTLAIVDGSSAAEYASVASGSVAVITTDNDSAGMGVVPLASSTAEGGTTTVTVVLNTQPTSDVVISATSSDTGEATVSPAQLTFTAANWDTAQEVVVTGITDGIVDGDQTATVTISVVDASSAAEYASVADQDVAVTVVDADSAAPTTTPPVTTTTTTTLPPSTGTPNTLTLGVVPGCSSASLTWAPSSTGGLTSYTLAIRDTTGAWSTHSSYAPGTLSANVSGLLDGNHAFQILANYTFATGPEVTLSPLVAIGVTSACAPVVPPVVAPTTTTTPPATTTTPPVTTTTPPVATTGAPTPTTVSPTPVTTTVAPPPTPPPATTTAPPPVGAPGTTPPTEPPPTEPPPTEPQTTNVDAPFGPGPGTAPDNAEPTERALGTENSDDESTGSPLTEPDVLTVAAGVVAAAGLVLSGLGAKILGGLLRFLGGTGFGLFLIGLFRRGDKRPGPPSDFGITTGGPLAQLRWSAPTTGGPPDRYIVEGQDVNGWSEVLELGTRGTTAAIPASETEGITLWRLRGANDHGIGKPSEEVEAITGEPSEDDKGDSR